MRHHRLIIVGIALLAAGWSGTAQAAQWDWYQGIESQYWDDYWDQPLSWAQMSVPGPGATVSIRSNYGAVLTPQYRSATSPSLLAIAADRPSGSGSVSFTQAQDTLRANTLTVGVEGPAAWTQSGGVAEFDLLRLGEWQFSTGTYRLQGGQLTTTTTDVGSSGQGSFYLSGTGYHSTETLWVADDSLCKVEGGNLSVQTATIDDDYLQTGGRAVIGQMTLQVGLAPPAAKADLRGGELIVGSTLAISFGTFEQSGGELDANVVNNGGPSLCSVLGGDFTATSFNNDGYFGQSNGNASVGYRFTNAATGTFVQSGGIWSSPRLVNNSANLTIMNAAECRALTFENNNAAELAGGLLRGTEAMPGLFFICQLTNTGTFTMSGGEFRGTLTNDGTFSYSAGNFTASQLVNNGTFSRSVPFSCMRLLNTTSMSAGTATSITANGGGYASAIDNSGTLTLSGTSLIANGTKPVVNSGELRGSGTIQADVQNDGIVTVGTSVIPATLTVTGACTQGSSGNLKLTAFEAIGGGASTDKLVVNSQASMGGTLTVSAGSGFTANGGDRLRVMTYGSFTGEFSTWILPTLPAGWVWGREQTSTSLSLLAIRPLDQDFDQDGDVDNDDFDDFASCASGPAIPFRAGCGDKDFDTDNDVDMADYGVFQRCLSGSGRPASANCPG